MSRLKTFAPHLLPYVRKYNTFSVEGVQKRQSEVQYATFSFDHQIPYITIHDGPLKMKPGYSFLITFTYGILSGLIPVLNYEVYLSTLPLYVQRELLIYHIIIATFAKMLAKSVLYFSGAGILKMKWLEKKQKTMESFKATLMKYPRSTWVTIFMSGFIGLPPLYGVSISAGAIGLSYPLFLVFAGIGRCLRFIVFTYAGAWILSWFGK